MDGAEASRGWEWSCVGEVVPPWRPHSPKVAQPGHEKADISLEPGTGGVVARSNESSRVVMRQCCGLPHKLVLVALALAGLYYGLSQARTAPYQSRGVRSGLES